MDDENRTHPDPEIAALLDFEPVPRKCPRRHGWSPENQRTHIAGLAETGDIELAADAVGLSGNGARQLRKCVGAEAFKAAWDAALDLYQARRPRSARPVRKGREVHGQRIAAAPSPEPAFDDAEERKFWTDLLARYQRKLVEERTCRLDGRVVAADFCVRQLTWLEVVFDLGGKAMEVMATLRRGEMEAVRIVATPMSLLLGDLRRHTWLEKGEPDRIPPPPLGEHDAATSTGGRTWYNSVRDGDYAEWRRRQDEAKALAAEAQRAWEEKAQKEAEEWARREASGDASDRATDAGHPPGDEPEPRP